MVESSKTKTVVGADNTKDVLGARYCATSHLSTIKDHDQKGLWSLAGCTLESALALHYTSPKEQGTTLCPRLRLGSTIPVTVSK